MMKVLLLAVSSVLFLLLVQEQTVRGEDTSSNLLLAERIAFSNCNTDHDAGLSWQEVRECEVRFGAILNVLGLIPPSEDDFDAFDRNGDGILEYGEWLGDEIEDM